jgi:hypothetical protein
MEHLANELVEASGITTLEEAQKVAKEWGVDISGRDKILERT